METKTIYNRGKREWDIAISREKNGSAITVHAAPGGQVELPEAIADKYLKEYSRDFMETKGATGNTARQLKAAKKKIVRLEEQKESMALRIEELETKIEEMSKGAGKTPVKGKSSEKN